MVQTFLSPRIRARFHFWYIAPFRAFICSMAASILAAAHSVQTPRVDNGFSLPQYRQVPIGLVTAVYPPPNYFYGGVYIQAGEYIR